MFPLAFSFANFENWGVTFLGNVVISLAYTPSGRFNICKWKSKEKHFWECIIILFNSLFLAPLNFSQIWWPATWDQPTGSTLFWWGSRFLDRAQERDTRGLGGDRNVKRRGVSITHGYKQRNCQGTLSRQINWMKTKFHFKFAAMGLKCHSKYCW